MQIIALAAGIAAGVVVLLVILLTVVAIVICCLVAKNKENTDNSLEMTKKELLNQPATAVQNPYDVPSKQLEELTGKGDEG